MNEAKQMATCAGCQGVFPFALLSADFRCFDCQELPAKDPGKHYRYEYKGIKLDPFRIAKVYGITDFGQQTILKKALRMGSAHKDRQQDLKDIICAAERMLEIMQEDQVDA